MPSGLYKKSKEQREKISNSCKGKKRSNDFGLKMKKIRESINNTGKHWKLSDETKNKIGSSHSGSKCNFWKGGISSEVYTIDWTRSLKIAIRERDKYTCKICGNKQNDIAFAVHHIDYNKKNCNPNNLITLCNSCHSKTNGNREYWIKYCIDRLI
jgi:hypothetical protein